MRGFRGCFSVSLILLIGLSACGKKKVTLEVGALPAKFGGKNPVALLKNDLKDKIGTCTASIVDRKFLLTAGHCVKNDGKVATSDQLTVYFQNPGDSESTDYKITAIKKVILDSTADPDLAVLSFAEVESASDRFGSFTSAAKATERQTSGEVLVYTSTGSDRDLIFQLGYQQIEISREKYRRGMLWSDDFRGVAGNSGGPVLVDGKIVGVIATAVINRQLSGGGFTELYASLIKHPVDGWSVAAAELAGN